MRLKKTFIEVLLTLLIISGTSFTYALLTDLQVSSGDDLTSTLWNNLVDHSVPSGAVMSFDLESCPYGWTEYTALQGKFIRGADIGANNDPDFATRTGGVGTRKIGSTQEDSFKSHAHLTTNNGNARKDIFSSDIQIGSTAQFDLAANTSATNPLEGNEYFHYSQETGDLETRGKNVYLLYCKKD